MTVKPHEITYHDEAGIEYSGPNVSGYELPLTLTTLAGITITRVSGSLDGLWLTVKWDWATEIITIANGADVDGSSDDVDLAAYSEGDEHFIKFDLIYANMPTNDAEENIYIEAVGQLIPDHETTISENRYYAHIIKNNSLSDIVDFNIWSVVDGSVATAISAGESLAITADSVKLDDVSYFPSNGFWAYNSTKDDFRLCTRLSGSVMYCKAVDEVPGYRGKTAQVWDGGDVIVLAPSIDIGIDPKTGGTYFDQGGDSSVVPDAAFAMALVSSPLNVGPLAAGEEVMIWKWSHLPPNYPPQDDENLSLIESFSSW